MAIEPIAIELTNGQKLEVLKRYYRLYQEELTGLEDQIRDIKTAQAEFAFLVQYLGEQPEVKKLTERDAELEKLEARRTHIGKLMERLETSIPNQGNDRPATIQRF
ncbi:MAG: hypothetical protein PF961_16780 [Planctomycetota bacterium]|jgi:hypothetical protein|nr:hypothetical protein [Planctomycetota bacterium]